MTALQRDICAPIANARGAQSYPISSLSYIVFRDNRPIFATTQTARYVALDEQSRTIVRQTVAVCSATTFAAPDKCTQIACSAKPIGYIEYSMIELVMREAARPYGFA
jgi:hypothetical protein